MPEAMPIDQGWSMMGEDKGALMLIVLLMTRNA